MELSKGIIIRKLREELLAIEAFRKESYKTSQEHNTAGNRTGFTI